MFSIWKKCENVWDSWKVVRQEGHLNNLPKSLDVLASFGDTCRYLLKRAQEPQACGLCFLSSRCFLLLHDAAINQSLKSPSGHLATMEQMAHERKPLFEGWNELPVELRDLILFWTTRGSPSMTAVIPFVCREILHRRSSWTLPSPPPTKRTFETKRDLNVKIAVDAASCGWLGVLQWLRGM